VFAGVSLQGATLRQDVEVNRDVYGAAKENPDIVLGATPVPDVAKPLVTLLNKYSARKSR
jgi:lipid-binding SYLF domain-containing protein